jgi:hypothetical protein
LSFYALIWAIASLDTARVAQSLANGVPVGAVSVFLILISLLFGLLWLTDIASALLAGEVPESVAAVALPVNPVHVLDLAFLLPGMLITAVLLKKRKPLGFVFAAPLLVFTAAMGVAIVSMWLVMNARGVAASLGVSAAMCVIVSVSLYLAFRLLRSVQA